MLELNESVNSLVVSALAQQHKHTRGLYTAACKAVAEPDPQVVTRDIIEAVAKKLDESEDNALEHIGQYEPSVYSGEVAARWLRSHTGDDPPKSP